MLAGRRLQRSSRRPDGPDYVECQLIRRKSTTAEDALLPRVGVLWEDSMIAGRWLLFNLIASVRRPRRQVAHDSYAAAFGAHARLELRADLSQDTEVLTTVTWRSSTFGGSIAATCLWQVIVITTASGPHANMDLAVQFEDIEICNRA
jgi:hypothetical protein